MTRKSHRSQGKSLLPVIFVIIGMAILTLIVALLTRNADIALLNPKGIIANQQYELLVKSTIVMLLFAVPVALAIYFLAYKYREGNLNASYESDNKENRSFLLFAWGGPLVVVIALASLMLPATQRLEPQQAIVSDNEQITIQVVALNWKWLFIYPEQNIATVNFAQIPVDTPIRFELTADGAPMSSFWIPHLGGMLYAMTGHVNPLHLMADTVGEYPGSTAEINGHGFAHMRFVTKVSTKEEFSEWVRSTKELSEPLTISAYENLREPSENDKPAYFGSTETDLYSKIIARYDSHGHDNHAYSADANTGDAAEKHGGH